MTFNTINRLVLGRSLKQRMNETSSSSQHLGRQLGVLAKQSTKFRLGSETVTKVISHDSGLLHVYPTAFHRQDDWP